MRRNQSFNLNFSHQHQSREERMGWMKWNGAEMRMNRRSLPVLISIIIILSRTSIPFFVFSSCLSEEIEKIFNDIQDNVEKKREKGKENLESFQQRENLQSLSWNDSQKDIKNHRSRVGQRRTFKFAYWRKSINMYIFNLLRRSES